MSQDDLLKELAILRQNTPQFNDVVISNYINNVNENSETLLGLQMKIKKKYEKQKKKNKLNLISYPDFFVINTPDSNGQYENLFTLGDGFKLYISLNIDNREVIIQNIIDFIIKSNISSQIKIRNFISNDAFTLSVNSLTDMQKILNYLDDNKKYKGVGLNPFIPEINNSNVCIDGNISYNRVLARLIDNYLYDKKVEEVSKEDFMLFIDTILNNIERNMEYYSMVYNLTDKRKYQDFVIVASIIRDNIKSKVVLNDLEQYKKRKIYKPSDNFEYTELETYNIKKNALIKIITDLKNQYYNEREDYIDYLHKVIKDYTDRNNINAFTRKNKVRFLIGKYYSSEEFKNYVMEIGYEYFLEICYNTKKKYGDRQFEYALQSFFQTGDMQYFTNDENIKSILKYIIPDDWLHEVIKDKNIYDEINNNMKK